MQETLTEKKKEKENKETLNQKELEMWLKW
jgi:hypothetical protein